MSQNNHLIVGKNLVITLGNFLRVSMNLKIIRKEKLKALRYYEESCGNLKEHLRKNTWESHGILWNQWR